MRHEGNRMAYLNVAIPQEPLQPFGKTSYGIDTLGAGQVVLCTDRPQDQFAPKPGMCIHNSGNTDSIIMHEAVSIP